jgi:hypothetical protein
VTRFVLFAVPLVVLAMALWGWGAALVGLEPDASALDTFAVSRPRPLPAWALAGAWLLEAIGLTGLFLLVQGRSGAWWLDGLLTGAIAWIFRGPLLVLTIASLTRLPRQPWWGHALSWLALYPLCGLMLAALARRSGLRR